jgi:hypothetical protein
MMYRKENKYSIQSIHAYIIVVLATLSIATLTL